MNPDTIVIVGDHPAAHAAALKLISLGIGCTLVDPNTTPLPDRLVTLNPRFDALLPTLRDAIADVPLEPVRSVRFVGPDHISARTTDAVGTQLDGHKQNEPLTRVVPLSALRAALRETVEAAGVQRYAGTLAIESVDESGVAIRIGRQSLRPKLMIVADPLPAEVASAIGAHAAADTPRGRSALATYMLKATDVTAEPNELPMALDLSGDLAWGWLLRAGDMAQLCVLHTAVGESSQFLRHWAQLLIEHGLLKEGTQVDARSIRNRTVPLAGALQGDVVARRSLLVGPAGGFYAATGEDVYPACWSAVLAAEVAAKAVKNDHVQDALGVFRGKWGSTLGEYLRGPQQNLRFLLPLVFKNPVMTDRLAEAVLRGQSLVK